MVSKLLLSICLLFLMMECLVESHQNPNEDQSVLLHRQKRSKELIDKIKKFVVSSVGGASKISPEHSSKKDSEASGTSHSFSSASKGKDDEKHSKKAHFDDSKDFGVEEDFDASKLIKSTLYTLLETFKAIGGAATAISGKLIKVSGYGVTYGGKLISASGDPITSLGKKISLKAKLLQPDDLHLKPDDGDDDSPSQTPNELVEFNHPHDATGFVPESNYVPLLGDGFDSQFEDFHKPSFQYGPQWPISYRHKRKSK